MQIVDGSKMLQLIDGGFKLEYNGVTDYMTEDEVIIPRVPVVRAAIASLRRNIPILFADLTIVLAPYRLRYRQNSSWTYQSYDAMRYPDHITVGGQKPGTSLESAICHELGHVFQNNCYPDLTEYKKIRGLSDSDYHDSSPQEIAAEDFRYLFGTQTMESNEFYMYVDGIKPPGEEVRRYMLSKVPPVRDIRLKIGSKTMFVNGQAVSLDVVAKIENGRTLLPVRAIAEALGCEVDWDPKTQEVRILQEVKTDGNK